MITLSSGRSRICLAPQYGAAITAFTHDGQDIFKPAEPGWAGSGDPMLASCFPLVPFSNRVRDGIFTWDGQRVEMIPPYSQHDHALHGAGWVRPWRVTQHTDLRCVCEYNHNSGAWPWDFTARQDVTLSHGRLTIALSVKNESATDMPNGMGVHPYFPNQTDATVTMALDGMWQTKGGILPDHWTELPQSLDFHEGVDLSAVTLDHCFTGFGGQAQIRWAGARCGVNMRADRGLDFAVIYVPEAQDYFCVEPVSHMNDALNWHSHLAGTGQRRLAPGEVWTLSTHFDVVES